jgi:hypothetical protein
LNTEVVRFGMFVVAADRLDVHVDGIVPNGLPIWSAAILANKNNTKENSTKMVLN